LKPEAAVSAPGRPRAVAASAAAVVVADDVALTLFVPETLTAIASLPFGRAPYLAGGGGVPIAAAATTGDTGRVCLVVGTAVEPCAAVPFAPTGLGVSRGGDVYVADGDGGVVARYTRRGDRLVARSTLRLSADASPHGTLVPFGGEVYVPVKRGVAVLDVVSGRVERTIRLATTPTSVWVVPFNGRMFAPLYARDMVAVADVAAGSGAPTLVQSGDAPVAVAGSLTSSVGGNTVAVVNSGDGSVARLDALTGARRGSARVPGLRGAPLQPLVGRAIDVRSRGRTVTVTLRFSGGHFDRGSLVLGDRTIADGRASFTLWQSGIRTRVRSRTRSGATRSADGKRATRRGSAARRSKRLCGAGCPASSPPSRRSCASAASRTSTTAPSSRRCVWT
jgi:hypothetical protein